MAEKVVHPITVIIGLLLALVTVIIAWAGLPIAWAAVIYLSLVIVGLVALFIWFANQSSWR